MSIGYASKTLAVPGAAMRSITQRLATPERLAAVIADNLAALGVALAYNARNRINLLRISSDVIPFGSSPVNTLNWTADFAPQLAALGRSARAHGMRLSMHPGQYTVLNSPDNGVVNRSVADLVYHAAFLDALELDTTAKIVLHVGGVYGDKAAALSRFARACETLPDAVRRRLVIENDDRLFTARDVLALSRRTGAPMVFDTLHHELNHELDSPGWLELLDEAGATWLPEDGPQKMHYAQQAPGRRPGSHADTIGIDAFLAFHQELVAFYSTPSNNHGEPSLPDIMLEVKDKNLSALKCILCTHHEGIVALEREWARYKYAVLEHDQSSYQTLRQLLKDKHGYPAVPFYETVEQALAQPEDPGSFRNAAQHVWGYVSPHVTVRERISFDTLMTRFGRGEATGGAVKRRLLLFAERYEQSYLLESYYFTL